MPQWFLFFLVWIRMPRREIFRIVWGCFYERVLQGINRHFWYTYKSYILAYPITCTFEYMYLVVLRFTRGSRGKILIDVNTQILKPGFGLIRSDLRVAGVYHPPWNYMCFFFFLLINVYANNEIFFVAPQLSTNKVPSKMSTASQFEGIVLWRQGPYILIVGSRSSVYNTTCGKVSPSTARLQYWARIPKQNVRTPSSYMWCYFFLG